MLLAPAYTHLPLLSARKTKTALEYLCCSVHNIHTTVRRRRKRRRRRRERERGGGRGSMTVAVMLMMVATVSIARASILHKALQ